MTEKHEAANTTQNETDQNEGVTYTEAENAEQGAEPQAAEQEEQEEQTAQDAVSVELEQLRKQADENYQRYLRAQADFDNFRRRSRQEKEEFAKYASAKLVEQLLPVVDNFERALAASKDSNDSDALAKGVDMISRQFQQVLEQEGLKPLDTVGQPFNPEFHQAIMQVESEEHEQGTVVEELQKGYMLKDKVLRPAMVKVSG